MKALTLRLPDEVHEALRREAFERRTSMQKIVEEAIQARFAATWVADIEDGKLVNWRHPGGE